MSVWNNPQPNDGYFAAPILATELLDLADVGPCLEKLLCHNFSRNKEVAATQSKDFVRRWADACQQFEKVCRGQDQNWDWEDEAEVKEALLHIDRAVQLGHVVREGSDSILTIGHSPDADQAWISAILAIRLPMYPKLRFQLISKFSGRVGSERDGRRTKPGLGDGAAGKFSDHNRSIRAGASLCCTPADPRGCSKERHHAPRFGKR